VHSVVEVVYLVAIAHVWARGSIFLCLRTHGPKMWIALADCPLCSGFWIGVIGHAMYRDRPEVIAWLGIGALVGTLSLATYGAIRRI